MRLSAQSIEKRCREYRRNWYGRIIAQTPMISPFSSQKLLVSGRSRGLSAASYDLSIADDLTLDPHPGFVIAEMLRSSFGEDDSDGLLQHIRCRLEHLQPSFALARSVEKVAIPDDVSAAVADKSSYARVFVSAFNTFFDPGFIGFPTLEIVNLSDQTVKVKAGDPICQLVFTKLDKRTNRAYSGKYQNQPARPVPVRLETPSGYIEGSNPAAVPIQRSACG